MNLDNKEHIIKQISSLYQKILLREPDKQGLDYFLAKIVNENFSIEELQSHLLNSPEGKGWQKKREEFDINSFERKIFSQQGEDGILDFIFSMIDTTNKFSLEIGCDDGRQCNTRYFLENGWNGLLIDNFSYKRNVPWADPVSKPKKISHKSQEPSIPSTIFNYVWGIIFYGPGVGRICTEKIRNHRVGRIETDAGAITIPVMKIPCFDLTFGFFRTEPSASEGLYEMEDFFKINPQFPSFSLVKTIETYWVLEHRRPKDVFGKKDIICYIHNELDGVIYLRRITGNNLIDYEKIYLEYEEALESKELIEREMIKIVKPSEEELSCCFNENCTTTNNSCALPERKQKDL